MENIERTQFVVLTGHLDDQPLPHLIRRLRVQRKSGRLQVEYPETPGSFFFEQGQLVDAQLGTLRGVEALYAALALDGASFNFNPLIRPPERNINKQEQQFIWDLVEGPRRENLAEIKVAGRELAAPTETPSLPRREQLQLTPAPSELIAPLEERLTAIEAAIVTTSRRFSRERLIYAMIISFLIGMVSVIALSLIFDPFFDAPPASTGATLLIPKPDEVNARTDVEAVQPSATVPVEKEIESAAPVERDRRPVLQPSDLKRKAKPARDPAQTLSPPTPASAARAARKVADDTPAARDGYLVQVLVEVKNGRVTEARVLNSLSSPIAYESRALKIAKQRRYPENFTGAEKLTVRVTP